MFLINLIFLDNRNLVLICILVLSLETLSRKLFRCFLFAQNISLKNLLLICHHIEFCPKNLLQIFFLSCLLGNVRGIKHMIHMDFINPKKHDTAIRDFSSEPIRHSRDTNFISAKSYCNFSRALYVFFSIRTKSGCETGLCL
jgi:hypothetical protein